MAMQTASKAPAHGKTASTGSTSSNGYPSMPASPTLTNPDMILPDYLDAAPSPDRSQSPLIMWKNAHAADMQHFDLGLPSFPSGPITPTTPIIYGNGTMLSDIGEVTEAESTCGPIRNGMSNQQDQGRTTPTMPVYDAMKLKKQEQIVARDRERRMSIESTSTITTVTNGDHAGLFADFDDSVSVDDSVFQGDDEESVASSYVQDDARVLEDRTMTPIGFTNGFPNDSHRSDDEKYAALSRRAEQILANAKRKLTTMEGNLYRARSSLSSAESEESTPTPFRLGLPIAIHRDHDSPQRGHNRTSSENNVPIECKPQTVYSPRASSAMGAAGGYRQPAQHVRSLESLRETPNGDMPKAPSIYGNNSFAKSKASLHDNKYVLEPLNEDEAEAPQNVHYLSPNLEGTQLDSFLSPTFGSFDGKGLRRSASTAQMRDIKDHMNDLKGRLSSLRDQARADSMKRRSLSSLRTPSPFTHARINQWYPNPKSSINEDDDASVYSDAIGTNGEGMTVEVNGSIPISDTDESLPSPISEQTGDEITPATKLRPADAASIYSGKATPMLTPPYGRDDDEVSIPDVDDDMDDMKTEDGYQEDDDVESPDDASDSESLYHDSVQNQVSHEDREDAFDYEHFFLHSAMGSMSRKKLERRGSESSYSSEDSVETTRGPAVSGVNAVGRRRSVRNRRASDASTSTMDSFLTATEGRVTRTDDVHLDELPEHIPEHISDQMGIIPEQSPSPTPTPATEKESAFEIEDENSHENDTVSSEPGSERPNGGAKPHFASHRRSQSTSATYTPRPSVSSFESTGTTRSFPLVNRAKVNGGVLTPSESPDQDLKQISKTLMSETASICDRESIHAGDKPIEMLQTEDQVLVERLVASLGRCVLALTESGPSAAESTMYRTRIDTARMILEGLTKPI